jgi:hypothetical protein
MVLRSRGRGLGCGGGGIIGLGIWDLRVRTVHGLGPEGQVQIYMGGRNLRFLLEVSRQLFISSVVSPAAVLSTVHFSHLSLAACKG